MTHICSNLVPAYKTIKTNLSGMGAALSEFEETGDGAKRQVFDEACSLVQAALERASVKVTYQDQSIIATDALVLQTIDERLRQLLAPGLESDEFVISAQSRVINLYLTQRSLRSTFDLSVIRYLSSLQSLSCGLSGLTALPDLPPSLQRLNCEGNQLTALPDLPPSLQILSCAFNKLTTLPKRLPPSLQELICGGNQLAALPDLPPSLQKLICGGNQLAALPDLPPSLQRLNCEGNQLTALPDLPPSLQDLDCRNNQLIDLPDLPVTLTFVDVTGNPNLSVAAKAKLAAFRTAHPSATVLFDAT